MLQFHFHFPSEHAIDGSLYAGELHIVHQMVGSKGTDDLLVVGVMLEVGAENSFLAQLGFGSLPAAKGDSVSIAGVVDLMAFSAAFDGDSYHYMGSLTTPPCSQTSGGRRGRVIRWSRMRTETPSPRTRLRWPRFMRRPVDDAAAGRTGRFLRMTARSC